MNRENKRAAVQVDNNYIITFCHHLITFILLNGLAANYIKDCLTPYKPGRSLLDEALLVIPIDHGL